MFYHGTEVEPAPGDIVRFVSDEAELQVSFVFNTKEEAAQYGADEPGILVLGGNSGVVYTNPTDDFELIFIKRGKAVGGDRDTDPTDFQEIEDELRKIEPFSSLHMGFVDCTDDQMSLSIRLEGNLNDKGTMFAGSIYSVLVLTGWALMKHQCDQRDGDYDVVIKESETSYKRPVNSAGLATAILINEIETTTRGSLSARINVSLLNDSQKVCATLKGTYIGQLK